MQNDKHLLKQKTKLITILAVEFVAILVVLCLVFFAGKKSHTVTFDLNGGILLSGDTEQRVTQGQSATAPTVAKTGHYLLGWSGSYTKVTGDVTVKAIWEYETTPGIEYSDSENKNYCEIVGSHPEINGDVYIGAYHDGKKVLSITDGVFKERSGITAVYLLDGILTIGDEAFAGCSSLEVIDIPSTVVTIGKDAFKGCENLKEIVLPRDLRSIEAGAFEGCSSLEKLTFGDGVREIGDAAFSGCSSLTEITLPESLVAVGEAAFDTKGLTVNLYFNSDSLPDGFSNGWCASGVTVVYGYQPPEEEPLPEKDSSLWGDLL